MKTVHAEIELSSIIPSTMVIRRSKFPLVCIDTTQSETKALGIVVVSIVTTASEAAASSQAIDNIGIVVEIQVLVEEHTAVKVDTNILPGAHSNFSGYLKAGDQEILTGGTKKFLNKEIDR